MAAGKIVGTNATNAGLISSLTVSATVNQPTLYKATTNATGAFNQSLAFVKYAFGNKEIIQIALGTNKITGYSLALSNTFTNGLTFKDIVDEGAVLAYSTKTNSVEAGDVFNPQVITEYAVAIDETNFVITNALVNGFKASGKSGVTNTYSETGFAVFAPQLDVFTNGCSGVGSFSATVTKAVFGKGTNAVTNTYQSSTFSGSFSGLFTEALP